MWFWHEKGWTLYQIVEQYMRGVFKDNDYKEVHIPQLIDKSLWEKSGHWDKFGDAMFTTSSENRDYAVKPMNCPAHIQIYNQGVLPIFRWSRFSASSNLCKCVSKSCLLAQAVPYTRCNISLLESPRQ
jgi:threonyl-tRNA synthetase